MVCALNLQAEGSRFESHFSPDNFQTISTPSSYSTCPWEYKEFRDELGDRQQHQVSMGYP